MPDLKTLLQPVVDRLTGRMDAIERASVRGQFCKVVNLSPLTVDLPGDPGVLVQGVPGLTYAVATSDTFNAAAFKLGNGGQYIIWPIG